YADLVGGLAFRNDDRVGPCAGFVEREQVAKSFHRARTVNAENTHEIRAGRPTQVGESGLARFALLRWIHVGLEIDDDRVAGAGASKAFRTRTRREEQAAASSQPGAQRRAFATVRSRVVGANVIVRVRRVSGDIQSVV